MMVISWRRAAEDRATISGERYMMSDGRRLERVILDQFSVCCSCAWWVER